MTTRETFSIVFDLDGTITDPLVGVSRSFNYAWQQIEALVTRGLIGRESVMVGDRALDLQAAHRSGFSSGGVLWGYGSRQELEKEHPRFLFSAPSELRILAEIE